MTNAITIDPKTREDAEFDALVKEMVIAFPTITSPGFDLKKLQGTFRAKSGKAIVLHLTLAGWSISDIADAVGVHPQLVIQQLEKAIREAAPPEDVELLRELDLQKLGSYEKICHDNFARSCEDKQVVIETEDENGTSRTTRTEPQSGNAAYIKLLVDIQKRRSDLTGMNQPTRVSVDKTTRQLSIVEVVCKTPQEVAAAKTAGLLK